MTQEDKDLLLRDLSARLPYGVKVTWDGKHPLTVTPHIYCAIISEDNIDNFPKLLLRPMSSMTEGERKDFYENLRPKYDGKPWESMGADVDWLNAHHFDYRGLILKHLALEAPEGMYTHFGDMKTSVTVEYKGNKL